MTPQRVCLIGESDPFIAQLLQRYAEEVGLSVVRAQLGEMALEHALAEQPELVLVDPELPGRLRGWEAARQLKAYSETSAVPIILCSWLSKGESMSLAPDSAAFLQKPDIHYRDFLEALQAAGVSVASVAKGDLALTASLATPAMAVDESNPVAELARPESLLLQVRGMKKAFPGVQALAGVDFDLRFGEVHALVGENGAGKSTFIKILSGAYAPDEGTITVNQADYKALTPRHAQELGIRTIYQERSLAMDLSVAENILMGRLPGSGFMVSWKDITKHALSILQNLEIDLEPDTLVGTLGVAKQQSVEIAKALYQKARIVIMDEPTSAFGRAEVERLFATVRTLRQQGISVIYISHHLEEVFMISDRVTVLRDGQVVGSHYTADTTPKELMNMMVGRDLSRIIVKGSDKAYPGERSPDEILRLEGLGRGMAVQDISLSLRKGEILGIAGMVGSGRSELARLIFGLARPDRGQILYKGQKLQLRDPRDAIRRGIALIPEDRKLQGLVLCLDLVDNANMAAMQQQPPLIRLKRLQTAARSFVKKLDIRTPTLSREVQYLSGGNQQKVVLAKWLIAGADLFIFDEPTRGVDVGAKLQIHQLIADLASQGRSILMISSDLPEVLALSDRILVMRKGRLVGEFQRAEATETKIIACALGETHGTN